MHVWTRCAALALMIASLCAAPHALAQAGLQKGRSSAFQASPLPAGVDLDRYKSRGPFSVSTQSDINIRLAANSVVKADLYLSERAEPAGLVIFMHGYDSSKEAHANQASHLASWGLHGLTVQLPPTGPWVAHGRTLARIVTHLRRSPDALDSRIDVNRIVLVGHSFGGFAAAVALAAGAPALGGILLDPAAIGSDIPNLLRRINKPILVLGADERIASARNRNYFFRFIRTRIAEVSITGAAHEDAQFPSEFALRNGGVDPDTTEELQITFAGALTAGAISLAATGTFDSAWRTYQQAMATGKLSGPKRK